MENEENNYSAPFLPHSCNNLDYKSNEEDHYLMKGHHHHDQPQLQVQLSEQTTQYPPPLGFGGTSSSQFDKLSFADVMQFASFGPKLALDQCHQTKLSQEEETNIDRVDFLKIPVLNHNKLDNNNDELESFLEFKNRGGEDEAVEARGVSGGANSMQAKLLGDDVQNPRGGLAEQPKNKRKRPRSTKTIEEVESQRMSHIAVERNRRKQMNEHLRVLRSLMPGSYVQRGDQASIVGGAIDFVRELEQLLQCLESQKQRRLFGDAPPPPRQVGADPSTAAANMSMLPPHFEASNLLLNSNDPNMFVEFETGLELHEENAESKSSFADVEVKVLGGDVMIKILSQRRPGQIVKAIAALEDLELTILHTNITTIEQTVLYCFKVASESRFVTAEDIARSVQHIFSFIHANTASL